MQKDRTDLIVNEHSDCPPIPFTPWERPIYISAIPTSSSLRYVFNTVMTGERGSIGWDTFGTFLILYLKVEAQDHDKCEDLVAGSEIWACFRVRES